MTDAPTPTEERNDPTAEGECRIDMPMKAQVNEDFEEVGT